MWTEYLSDRSKLLEESMTHAVQVRSAWHVSGEISLVLAYRLLHCTEDNCEHSACQVRLAALHGKYGGYPAVIHCLTCASWGRTVALDARVSLPPVPPPLPPTLPPELDSFQLRAISEDPNGSSLNSCVDTHGLVHLSGKIGSQSNPTRVPVLILRRPTAGHLGCAPFFSEPHP